MIRQARPEDLGDLRRIIVAAFHHETIHYLVERRFGVVEGKTWDQRKGDEIESFLGAHPEWVLVTELDGEVAGFVTYALDEERKVGQVQNNAVDPRHQNRGIGTGQVHFVLDIFRREGMKLAEVVTGLGSGYAPARRMYEKCGFEALMENVRYYRCL
jgi:GNAT superfamily N-acetyltransferase